MNSIVLQTWLRVALVTVVLFSTGCPGTGPDGDLTARVAALEADLADTQAELADTQGDLSTVESDLVAAVEDLKTAQEALAEAQQDVDVATAKLANVSVVQGTLNGVVGPHFMIEGCNVHVRSGVGDTEDSSVLSGRGNLIIGYNESPVVSFRGRGGSHNLVIGQEHEYSSFGGLVAGQRNAVSGEAATVIGGNGNVAEGRNSSVSGGETNTAAGEASSVTGGSGNEAVGGASSVTGGSSNLATGARSSVSGGDSREAPQENDWAAGSLLEDS